MKNSHLIGRLVLNHLSLIRGRKKGSMDNSRARHIDTQTYTASERTRTVKPGFLKFLQGIMQFAEVLALTAVAKTRARCRRKRG